MTIREAVRQGAQLLRTNSSGCHVAVSHTPALDSELLMGYALSKIHRSTSMQGEVAHFGDRTRLSQRNISRGEVIARGNDLLDADTQRVFFHYVQQRQAGTPVAYITGVKEFYGLPFAVTPDVLIPKSDTERLVELAVEYIKGYSSSKAGQNASASPSRKCKALSVADICCGSGCIGISVAHECGNKIKSLSFTDISTMALEVCKGNAETLLKGIGNSNLDFLCGDLLDVFPNNRLFDLILSNPPYIPSKDVTVLLQDGRGEPRLALDGDAAGKGATHAQGERGNKLDGLSITRHLVPQAVKHLSPFGCLMVESSETGVECVAEMMRLSFLQDVRTYTDLAGLPRVAVGIAACR